jgi:hypothetical protein
MRVAIEVLLAGSVALTAAFLILLGPPWLSAEPKVAWLLAAWGWVTLALELLILLVLLRVAVPSWLALIVLLAQDGVWVWRLAVLRRARYPHDDDTEARL